MGGGGHQHAPRLQGLGKFPLMSGVREKAPDVQALRLRGSRVEPIKHRVVGLTINGLLATNEVTLETVQVVMGALMHGTQYFGCYRGFCVEHSVEGIIVVTIIELGEG